MKRKNKKLQNDSQAQDNVQYQQKKKVKHESGNMEIQNNDDVTGEQQNMPQSKQEEVKSTTMFKDKQKVNEPNSKAQEQDKQVREMTHEQREKLLSTLKEELKKIDTRINKQIPGEQQEKAQEPSKLDESIINSLPKSVEKEVSVILTNRINTVNKEIQDYGGPLVTEIGVAHRVKYDEKQTINTYKKGRQNTREKLLNETKSINETIEKLKTYPYSLVNRGPIDKWKTKELTEYTAEFANEGFSIALHHKISKETIRALIDQATAQGKEYLEQLVEAFGVENKTPVTVEDLMSAGFNLTYGVIPGRRGTLDKNNFFDGNDEILDNGKQSPVSVILPNTLNAEDVENMQDEELKKVFSKITAAREKHDNKPPSSLDKMGIDITQWKKSEKNWEKEEEMRNYIKNSGGKK